MAFGRQILDWRKASVFALAFILLSPVFALIILSFGDSEGLWPHLVSSVLGKYISTTLLLMIGVGCLSLLLGVTCAWIIAAYRFRFSKWLDFIILLPIACPAYLVAYAYTDFFEYAGPVQVALRQFMGWQSARDYYFPEIRSLGGAIFVLSSVLYPYIYLLARTAFRHIPENFYEVAALSNRSVFWNIALPLGRPAIVAGLALVSMEVVSDFGTVEFFALDTLTLGIFNVWIGMDSITGAAQIATVTFAFIIILLFAELYSRGSKRFNDTSRRQAIQHAKPLVGTKSFVCILICLVPIGFGFFIPVGILLWNVFMTADMAALEEVWSVLQNSVYVSVIGAFIIMLSAITIASSSKVHANKSMRIAGNLSAAGYAFPGTMLAIGVLSCLGMVDQLLSWTSIYLSGTLFALFFAYLVRFQAVGYGAVSSGLTKIPLNMMSCSRSLGLNAQQTTLRVTIPLIQKSIIAGAVLAFVDIMKELPMTLLLRPFNFETLATYSYQFAHDELMDQASLPALIIIVVGLVPVIFLNKLLRA